MGLFRARISFSRETMINIVLYRNPVHLGFVRNSYMLSESCGPYQHFVAQSLIHFRTDRWQIYSQIYPKIISSLVLSPDFVNYGEFSCRRKVDRWCGRVHDFGQLLASLALPRVFQWHSEVPALVESAATTDEPLACEGHLSIPLIRLQCLHKALAKIVILPSFATMIASPVIASSHFTHYLATFSLPSHPCRIWMVKVRINAKTTAFTRDYSFFHYDDWDFAKVYVELKSPHELTLAGLALSLSLPTRIGFVGSNGPLVEFRASSESFWEHISFKIEFFDFWHSHILIPNLPQRSGCCLCQKRGSSQNWAGTCTNRCRSVRSSSGLRKSGKRAAQPASHLYGLDDRRYWGGRVSQGAQDYNDYWSRKEVEST